MWGGNKDGQPRKTVGGYIEFVSLVYVTNVFPMILQVYDKIGRRNPTSLENVNVKVRINITVGSGMNDEKKKTFIDVSKNF